MEVNIQEKNEFYARLTIKKLEEMAEQGDAWAQFELGVCYSNGIDVVQDYKQAVKWWNPLQSWRRCSEELQKGCGVVHESSRTGFR